jgi:RimJ/RimL family protein N-acetyltransferase
VTLLSATYSFVPLDSAGFQVYCAWYAADPEQFRISPPTPQWFDYIQRTPGAHAWLIVADDGRAVGLVQLDEEAGGQGAIMLYVAPEARGRGHGRNILGALLARPDLAAWRLRTIVGEIDPTNVASLRCALAAGFELASPRPDADGLLNVAYHF